jgi:hypothetical protein
LCQDLAQDGARPGIQRKLELQVHPVLDAVLTLPQERETVRFGANFIDRDLRPGWHVRGAQSHETSGCA